MADEPIISQAPEPGVILDTADPGDDVQLRFRYQHAYTAIQCVRLIMPNPEFIAVYCENHEDVLLRKATGKYVGVQVKTRKFDLEPFKATDQAVMRAIGRFAHLEAIFPQCFDEYRFVTNHSFFSDEDNPGNLKGLLFDLRTRRSVRGLRKQHPLRSYVCSICDAYSSESLTEAQVVEAMLKMGLIGFESGIEHTHSDLRDVLGQLADCEDLSLKLVFQIADNLVYSIYEASSKKLGGCAADLYAVVVDFDAQRDQLILAGKALTAERVQELIQKYRQDGGVNLLVSANLVPGDLVPPDVAVMEAKLLYGGLELERVNKLKDFKSSMEAAYLRWFHKFGVAEANRRLIHLKTLVEDDCIEAKLPAAKTAGAYASPMYTALRSRLDDRVCQEMTAQPLFGCKREHLLGIAGMLTEECRVWWSEPFELKSQGAK